MTRSSRSDTPRWRRWLLRVVIGLLALVLIAAAGGGGWLWWKHDEMPRHVRAATRAGFVHRDAVVDGARIHYVEGGSGSKPALLLIHGQGMDWRSYGASLPDLAKDFHVYAVDCFGHGQSAHDPALYNVVAGGAKLVGFVHQVIKSPTIVTGHSSGGVLAAYVAAHGGADVRAVFLEDPPLFMTQLPQARTTWNYVDLATVAHDYLQSGQTDWPLYSWIHQRMWKFFGTSAKDFIDEGVRYHSKHPDRAISVWFAPQFDRMNETLRSYDPRFGDAFYTGTWDSGFDTGATLRAIDVPAVLLQTKVDHDGDILMSAMDEQAAERAVNDVDGMRFVKVETGHEFHEEDPAQFVQILRELAGRS